MWLITQGCDKRFSIGKAGTRNNLSLRDKERKRQDIPLETRLSRFDFIFLRYMHIILLYIVAYS